MPPQVTRVRKRFSSTAFYAWPVFFVALLAIYSFFIRGPAARNDNDRELLFHTRSGEDCRLLHQVEDKCEFVKQNCRDDEAGLIEYLTFYYCSPLSLQPISFVALIVWLGLLFTTIGIAASDFFSVNLSTIATILGLSESLAGVTFLAFGNGSPDVFSTFAAMSSNSGSMAVGELIGAAGFITAVVAGSMALVREFKVGKKTFVRDIGFFIVAVGFSVGFLSDGHIHLWECCVMIAFYLFYVIVVVGWHAISKRRKAFRAKEAMSRSYSYASGNDELEPYRDDPDYDGTFRGGPNAFDFAALERAPRIEIDDANGVDADDDSGQHVAAEMTSSMRVNKPRGRRSTTTITPIRPSLIGALEFRSVLSSLQDEKNMRMGMIHVRSHSVDGLNPDGGRPSLTRGAASAHTVPGIIDVSNPTRTRAQSSGDVSLDDNGLLGLPGISLTDDSADRERNRSPSTHTVGGKLAPPRKDATGHIAESILESRDGEPTQQPTSPKSLRLHIPNLSPHGSEQSSPALSPFPSFTDSPMPMTSSALGPAHLMLSTPSMEQQPILNTILDHEASQSVRWWPYQMLPAPHVLMTVMFPTLQGWRNKTIWDKIVSLVSVPSIFLLVITLPVVESETTDDDSSNSLVEQPVSGGAHLGNTTASVSYEHSGSIEPETEWQRYRRSTRSRGSSVMSSPNRRRLVAPDETRGSGSFETVQPHSVLPDAQLVKPALELGTDNSTLASEDPVWNRWLLILQIFTGPMFAVLIVWANMAEDLDQPGNVLAKAVLSSLVCSFVLLGILLMTTSPNRRPRWHFLFCFLGFCIAIAWISTIAGEVVGVLKAFGVILDISEAILGLTVFAVGNSVGDLVADVTVARLGYPVMALSACFGGPMLNILLGIGLGGAYQTIQAANKNHKKHPDKPLHYKAYTIQVGGTLLVSAAVLLLTLLTLLISVPLNKWVMSKKLGWALIAIWSIGTTVNLMIETTGLWRDIAQGS